MQARKEMEEDLEQWIEEKTHTERITPADIPFTRFLVDWLEMMESSVEVTTYASYSFCIKSKIVPYFDKRYPEMRLWEVTPKHIQDYYNTYKMKENGMSANTVIHRHANIRRAFQYAFKKCLLDNNPADRIERPKKKKFAGSFYNKKELERLFEAVRDDPIELGVILATFHGLRNSEAISLKWDAIDF